MKRTEKSNHLQLLDTRKKPFYRRRHIVSVLPGMLLFLALFTFMFVRYHTFFVPTGETAQDTQKEKIIGAQDSNLPAQPSAPVISEMPQEAPKPPETKTNPVTPKAERLTSPPVNDEVNHDIAPVPGGSETPAKPVITVMTKPTPEFSTPTVKKKKTGDAHRYSSRAATKLKKSLSNKHVLKALALAVMKKKTIDVRRDSSKAAEKLRKK